ncbi:MAG: hypothetical protein RIR95_1117 [Pseudomonadota bacterium]
MQKLLATVAVVGGMFFAPASWAETLADALISAYKTSNLLDQNQALLRAADENVAVAMSKLRPVVNFAMQGSWRRYNNNSASFSLPSPNYESLDGSIGLTSNIVIYSGGRVKMGVELAKESVLATRAALINVEQNVLLNAVSAYVDVRLQAEIVALRESNVRLIAQELRAAQDRFEVGEVTLTDVSLAEARLAASQSGLAAAQGSLEIARESFKATTGSYPQHLAGLPKLPKLPKTEDEARNIAVKTHPSVIQAQHQAKLGALQVGMAKAGYGPTVTGQVSLSNDLAGLTNLGVGISANQTLYSGGETSALYRQALANKEAADSGVHLAVVGVSQSVGAAWANLMVAQSSIHAGAQQVEAAQKGFDGVREEATLGARTTLDVLNAEQELLNARASKLQSEAGRYVGAYQLLSAMGLLTVDHLNLGIPTYDPEAYYDAVKNAPSTSTQGKALDRILEKIAN